MSRADLREKSRRPLTFALCIREKLLLYLKILTALSLFGSLAWVIVDPGFESGLAVVGSASAVLGLFVTGRRRRPESSQKQVVSGRSIGIQAGGDVSIGNTKRKDNA